MNDFLKTPSILLLFVCSFVSAQETKSKTPWSLDASYFYGSIWEHNPAMGHLITDHPQGFLLSYSRKTLGNEAWERYYNRPDVGYSFLYQDMGNPHLGDHYGVYAHLGFYFLKRNLLLKTGTGIAYNTNPYDQNTNYRNNAYGTSLLSSTFLMLNFKHGIFENLDVQTGIVLVHYSNANFKAPNKSTNTIAFNLGLNYSWNTENLPEIVHVEQKQPYSEPVHYNFVIRGGVNSSDIIGMGQYPFYIFSMYADKRISWKSGFMAGAEIFFSGMLKELIYYKSVAYPEETVSGDEDSKRIGIFGGYQLYINKFSAYVNLGYYAYYPYEFEGRVYNRFGVQYRLSPKWFVGASVKSHAAKAEAAEFSIGFRL